ncbi:aldehyde dehydrogenase family protein, partial [Nocardia sp. 2]
MIYAKPGADGSVVNYAARYDNFIGGDWVAPVEGRYFANPSPVDGENFCEIARSGAADIDLALDAAHRAAESWGATSVTERANILNRIADRIEEN